MSVVYNPSNQTMHGGDNPHFTEVDMSLAFTETRTFKKRCCRNEGKLLMVRGNYFKNFEFCRINLEITQTKIYSIILLNMLDLIDQIKNNISFIKNITYYQEIDQM